MKSILVKKANQNNLLNFSKKTLLVIMCLCLSFVVWATDYTWTGGGVEGKWDDPDNWDGSGFPSTSDNAVISQNVTITAPETGIDLQKITIVENFSLTLGSTVKMNVVELIVNTGSSLTISSGATLYVDRLSSYGTTINDGSIEKHPTEGNNKIVAGNGSFINNGTVNQKEFEVTGNASVTNNSNLTIDSNITIGNGASLSNSENASVISRGTITNSGNLDNNGTLSSYGSITTSSSISNKGSITNDGGTISGSIDNTSGTVTNTGGTIFGTVTGNEVDGGGVIDPNSYSTITSSNTLNWSDPATWEDQNGDGEGDIPDISGEKEITITLNANVNVDGVSGFFNKGNNKITLAGSKKFYYGGRRAYLSQGNGTGPDLDWTKTESWIGGEVPNITGSEAVSIILNGDMEATNQNFSQSANNKICLFTNGYNLNLNGKTCFGKDSELSNNSGHPSNLHFYGKGKIYINVLEFAKKGGLFYPENEVHLYDGIEIYIEDHISALNTKAEIHRDSEESKFYLNASGTNVNWYTATVNINWIDFEPIPYKKQTFFQLFEDGENPISGNSGSGKKITFGRIADTSAKKVTFKYKVKITNTSGVTWSLGTQTLADTAGSYTGSVQMTEVAAADVLAKKELYLKSSGPLNPGDGIIITFRTPDDKMDMCEIRYIEGELLWTGAISKDVLEPGNWSFNESLTVDGLTELLKDEEKEAVIGSGATNYPVISSNVEVSKLTLKNGANITVKENGVLTVKKGLSFEGNSKIDAKAGKVIFTGTGTEENPSFEATYPEFSTFRTLEVASGATFVTKTDLHITTALTNYGTFRGNKVYLGPSETDEPSETDITITGQLGDSLEIANNTKISELYCENQADKNLIFKNTIAVDKLVLSGFANTSGSRLTIKDSSGIIYLSNDCFEAYYLFLADSSLPTIKNSFVTIFESNTENILDKDAFVDKNWRFRDTDVFIWTGAGLDNNWKNPHNWDSRMVPKVGKTVIIPADCSVYPILEENLNLIDINAENSHDSILIAVGASLDFNGKEVAISLITNNGTLDLGGSKVSTNELVNGGTIRANGGETLQTQTSTPIGITNSTVYEDSIVVYYFKNGIQNPKIINIPFGSGNAQTYINLVIESGFSGSCDRGIIIKKSLKFKNSSGDFDLVCENLGIPNVAELSGAIELKNLTDFAEIKFAGNGIFIGTMESSRNTKITSEYGRICFDSNIVANFNSPLTIQTNALDNGFLPAGTINLGSTCEVLCNLFLTNQVKLNLGGKLSVGTQAVPKDVYISAMEAGSPLDVEIAPKDATNQEFQVYGNFLLLNGNAKISTDLIVGKDMILLDGENPSMFNDPISGIEGLFAYNLSGRGLGGKTAAINFTNDFPTTLPKGTASGNNHDEPLDSTKYVSTFDFATGKTILVWNNFYNNGVDLGTNTTGTWNLKFPANDVATSSFAECYNATITNCKVAANTTPGEAWLATENCVDGTGNTNVAFSKAILANVATISDNIIRVSFVDGNSTLDEKPEIKIENSCNEISTLFENFRFNISSELPEGIKFSGIFANPECTDSTNGKGDLSTFYLKYEIPTDGSTDYSWNTDATGSDPGAEESTDANGIHKKVVPNLGLVRALTASYAGLRDEHKNRLVSVGTNTTGAEPLFEATKDEVPPVLVAVTLGQEQHETVATSQHHYDSHNFIEWQFSEAVEITYNSVSQGGFGTSTGTEILSNAENIQTTENFGKITNANNGFSVAGLGSFQNGKVTLGSKTGSGEVNAFYRKFALEAGEIPSAQESRIRLSIAGYVDEGNPVTVNGVDYNNWLGFIDSKNTTIPSGTFTMEDSVFLSIKDKSENKNVFEPAKNQPVTVNKVLSLMDGATKGKTLYGTWDIDPPVVANYMKEGSDSILAQELIPEGSSVNADCLEVHFLDNASFNEIDGKDNWKWRTKLGWKNGENHDVVLPDFPLDIRGGSRMTTTENKTFGGIRIGTLSGSISAFTFKNIDISQNPQNFREEIIQKVDTEILFGSSGTVDFDTGYLKLYLADSVGSENLMVNNYVLIYKDGYVTDLAGNRMENFEAKSLDKNPPKFYMSVSGVDKDKVYILFTKPLDWRDSNGNPDEGKLRRIVKSLSIFDSSQVDTGLIDYSQGSRAKIITETQKSTGIEISLTDSISYETLKEYYIGVNVFATGVDAGEGDMAAGDPITGNSGYYSMLYDYFENPILVSEKHCISDFAVNALDVLYAYDGRAAEEANLGFGIFGDQKWTVTNFSKNVDNASKIFANKDISIVTKIVDSSGDAGTQDKFSIIADISPDSNATGTKYEENSGYNTRLWLPESFNNFGDSNNSSSLEKDNLIDGTGKIENTISGDENQNITFMIPNDSENPDSLSWKANSQIQFVFQVLDSSGNPIIVDGNKDGDTDDIEDHPLYAVRLEKEDDLSTLDLWSLDIVELQKQSAGVTITNNVINSKTNEKTFLHIVVPKTGYLTVQVLTLDGNVVKVLERSLVQPGEYTYNWDGRNLAGDSVARGMYFIRVVGPEIDETKKVMVIWE